MRKFLLAIPFVALAGIVSARAEIYPSRPITIVVPFSAGGPTDTIARIMADRLQASLGQTLIVENVTGAAGSIGVGRVARASPDGYTMAGQIGMAFDQAANSLPQVRAIRAYAVTAKTRIVSAPDKPRRSPCLRSFGSLFVGYTGMQ
jgi:tripartite-type tricarboxylate transporter receptor subunit TctC